MPIRVTDASSHRQEKIANAARVVGRSPLRQKVFDAICSGKKQIKTIEDIQKKTRLNYMQIRQSAVVLMHEDIVDRAKVDGELAYGKVPFYSKNKKQILRLASNGKKLAKFPTSYTPKPIGNARQFISIRVPVRGIQVRRVTVDDIDSFREVKRINDAGTPTPHSESVFKKGLQRILREPGSFKDWGGETDDLFSTRLKLDGKRVAVAFGLKGKGTKGKLTPKKMGKNGDQIQRLLRSPADLFLVQYWNTVDSSIHELIERLAIAKSAAEGRKIYYGVIDGEDSLRLLKAYPRQFKRNR